MYFAPHPHVLPYQAWVETPTAGYVIRQYMASNLYDRLSTRPFLTAAEKRWVTLQLLAALTQAHAQGVVHGDIKCGACAAGCAQLRGTSLFSGRDVAGGTVGNVQ